MTTKMIARFGSLEDRRARRADEARERAWGERMRSMRATVGMAMGTAPVPKPIELAVAQRGWVYFIRAASGAIKIGRARNVRYRLTELQCAHPDELTVIAVAVDGGREAEYHRQFAEHRRRGEWFDPHPDILAETERLNDLAPKE